MRKLVSVWFVAEGNVQVLTYIFHVPKPVTNVCKLFSNLYDIKTQKRRFETRDKSSFYSALPYAVSSRKNL
jgi:hypothetical protein